LRRGNIGSYRYKIINWGLVLLRAETLCVSAFFVVEGRDAINRVCFEFADCNKMINATEMAGPFRKQIGQFLTLQGTREYILLLESRYRDSDIGGKDVLKEVVE
jgi:hypothetical protein